MAGIGGRSGAALASIKIIGYTLRHNGSSLIGPTRLLRRTTALLHVGKTVQPQVGSVFRDYTPPLRGNGSTASRRHAP